jgi:type IV secretory pathway VirB2 component (pilin)
MDKKSTKTPYLSADALYKVLLLAFYLVTIELTSSTAAYATNSPMGVVLCVIIAFVYGNMGRALATLAICIIGAGATLGKVSWGLAVIVGVGIGVMFGASTIMTKLTGFALTCTGVR